MVLGSIIYIRKTIHELTFVPPYQGMTLVFFVNLLLFATIYIAYFLFGYAFWRQVVFGPYYYYEPITKGKQLWRDNCFYLNSPGFFGLKYNYSIKVMCEKVMYQQSIIFLAQVVVGVYCNYFVLYLIYRFTKSHKSAAKSTEGSLVGTVDSNQSQGLPNIVFVQNQKAIQDCMDAKLTEKRHKVQRSKLEAHLNLCIHYLVKDISKET